MHRTLLASAFASLFLLVGSSMPLHSQGLVYQIREVRSETGFDPETSTWTRANIRQQRILLVGPQVTLLQSREVSPGVFVTEQVAARAFANFELRVTGRGRGAVRTYTMVVEEPVQERFPDPVNGPNFEVEGGVYLLGLRINERGNAQRATISPTPEGGTGPIGNARFARPSRSSTPIVFAGRMSQVLTTLTSDSYAGTFEQNAPSPGFLTDLRESYRLNPNLTESVQGLNFTNAVASIQGYLSRQGYTFVP